MASLSGKIIAITGAASGIGRATAHLLAARGASLSLADVQEPGLSSTRSSILSATPAAKIHTQAVNVVSSAEVNAWHDGILKEYGRLDAAANLAGILRSQICMIEDMPDEEWDRVLGVNLKGVFNCTRAQLRVIGMREGEGGERSGGSIVNAASIAGMQGSPGQAAYSTSKHGVIGLTRSAAKEVGKRGLRVNCIAPGPIYTPMTSQLLDAAPVEITQKWFLGRPGKPEEVAKLIAFLLSDESSYVTGSVSTIDAGWTA